jgi:hypothetical protein
MTNHPNRAVKWVVSSNLAGSAVVPHQRFPVLCSSKTAARQFLADALAREVQNCNELIEYWSTQDTDHGQEVVARAKASIPLYKEMREKVLLGAETSVVAPSPADGHFYMTPAWDWSGGKTMTQDAAEKSLSERSQSR